MAELFGTDGIRGAANREPLIPETLARIGRAIGRAAVERGRPKTAVLGRDTRESGGMVCTAVAAGLAAEGFAVRDAGILSTPAVALLLRRSRAGLGIAVSASHNPWPDNGVKVFLAGGFKADRKFEARVEAILAGPFEFPDAPPGPVLAEAGAATGYAAEIRSEFRGRPLAGLRLVVDSANGALAGTAPAVLARLGAEVHPLFDRPNGRNINERCGALCPEVVARAVRREKAAAGVAFDGDGDRALFADERGRVIDGDATLAVLARHLVAKRRLPRRTVVATVMSNLGLARSLAEAGVALVTVPVGDRSVVEAMRSFGYGLGGEPSGHVVVRRGTRLVGDGLVTAVHLLRTIREEGRPLSDLAACFARAPQHLVNVPVRAKPPLDTVPALRAAIRAEEERLGTRGRVLVRYSGTEPLARVMVEGPTAGETRRAVERIAVALRETIGRTS
ncbi:MAG: phosphoglucosamine mutase [Planctomycetes bacterium]|jgi:phosphoglucosamine mutase|nr:phosphoglucosamine mutase [Planctomycetota bacterium]